MAPRITVEELGKVQTFLDKKIGNIACSTCGGQKRTLHPSVFSFADVPADIVESANGRFVVGGVPGVSTVVSLSGADTRVYVDLMFTTCDNCGHVDFFNAHQLLVQSHRSVQKE